MQSLFGEVPHPHAPTSARRARAGAAMATVNTDGPFAAVALEHSVDKLLDYAVPAALRAILKVGQRVRVPLGRNNHPSHGYVITIQSTSSYPTIKPLLGIDDERVLFPPRLMELARWMSRYYVSPLGTVLESVVPSAVKKKVGLGYSQIVRLAKDREEVQAILEKTKAPKRRAILARLLQIEPGGSVELVRLAGESGATPPTVRKLARLGLITITPEVDLPGLVSDVRPSAGDEPDIAFNEDQQRVFDELRPRVTGGFSVNLIHGVTGSGKTEIYLQCIREVVARGRRAIVLVPEIALTPQTVRRFTARFTRVAILHSGLTATERHRFWQQISIGMADVIVGARSAVFAPVPDLGMIVVDEEHESSYKQDTAPRYHARDVAIKRGQLEDVPVLLGSATPSLETYHKAMQSRAPAPGEGEAPAEPLRGGSHLHASVPPEPNTPPPSSLSGAKDPASTSAARAAQRPVPDLPAGSFAALKDDEGRIGRDEGTEAWKGGATRDGSAGASPSHVSASPTQSRVLSPQSYHLLSLPRRVRGLQMPHVELVDMKMEGKFRRGVHLVGQRLEHLLRVTIDSGHQAILLLNRRGYSNFVYCVSCTNVVGCKYCDTTMTYHRAAGAHAHSATSAEGAHTGQIHCHYCLAVDTLPEKCPHCGKKLSLFGLGTQRVEEEIARKFPDLTFARVDSDTMRSARDYEALLTRFAKREIQVMLGTQMIAKGLDYPNVTLVGVISGDTALALPDFRAAERTFQLITQVAGRAGRGDNPGRVVLQTFLPDDPTIQAAIKQDFVGFARAELAHRRQVGLPPYARMVRVILRDQEQEKLHKHSEELASALSDAVMKEGEQVRMKGPMPCAISRIAGYYRNQIVLLSPSAGRLQKVLAAVREQGGLARSDRIAVDVDPVSLL